MDNVFLKSENIELSESVIENLYYLINKSKRGYCTSHKDMGEALEKYINANELTQSRFERICFNIMDYYSFSISLNTKGLSDQVDDNLQNELINESKEFMELYNDEKKMSKDELINMIKICKTIIEKQNLFFFLRDMKYHKQNYLEDMKYYMKDQDIEKWSMDFDLAIKQRDVYKAKQLLQYVIDNNLNEWNKYINDFESISQDNFMFIGHSLKPINFEGNFHTNYISCSLFNQNNISTFNSRYGFIFNPNNMVGASYSDMYVNNLVELKEDITNSSIPIIHHPFAILKRMEDYKKENERKNSYQKVYSEIVHEGFDPIGIFCFTTGIKEFEYEYNKAIELSNKTGLRIKFIDALKLSKGEELERLKKSVIDSIFFKKGYSYNLRDENLFRYSLFFKSLDELKKAGEYTKNDVLNIFDRNEELISIFTSVSDIFDNSKSYNKEEKKYALENGYNNNFGIIINGEATAFMLEKLNKPEYHKYKHEINELFPGFEVFMDLNGFLPLNIDLYNQMKDEIPDLTFKNMASYMARKVKDNVVSSEKTVMEYIKSKKIALKDMIEEKNNLEADKKKHSKCELIIMNEYMLNIYKNDLTSIEESSSSLKVELENQNKEKEKIENEIQVLNEKINSIKNSAIQEENNRKIHTKK